MDTVGLNKTLIRHYGKSGFEFLGIKPLKSTSGLPEHYKAGEVCYFQKNFLKNQTIIFGNFEHCSKESNRGRLHFGNLPINVKDWLC
jgi:hypothetical protein